MMLKFVFLMAAIASRLIDASFPIEPITLETAATVETANTTETHGIGTVAECKAIATGTEEGVNCGSSGSISARGICSINMWPGQGLIPNAAECALYCQNRVGDYYKSFGLYSTQKNLTIGFNCECYDTGVGALKLANVTVGRLGRFYDSRCFEVEC